MIRPRFRSLSLSVMALAAALAVSPVGAQSPAEQAERARDMITQAASRLDEAEGARDRIRALTETIRGFETGLAAMREGLRQAAIRERALEQDLVARDAEIGRLLTTLQSIGRTGAPTALLHPEGAVGTARAGMLLADMAPALSAQAQALRSDLEEVETLRQLQQAAANDMAGWLAQVQQARTDLNQAMAERTDLPRRFTQDPVRAAILIASSETLDAFASGLSEITEGPVQPAPLSVELSALPPPVNGALLRRANEADAAGVTRPGILYATRPGALVTTPVAATVRYVGPLLDFGQVIILEPAAGALIVLAGLGQTYGEAGQVLPAQSPVGLMGGTEGSPDGEGGGNGLSETLYIETRQNGATVDPEKWFRLPKNG